MLLRVLKPGDRTVFILIGLLSSIFILFAYRYRPGFLTALDLKAMDAMLAARGSFKAPEEVIIVAVDEKSVNELGRWPWRRETVARLITGLKPAKVVALDIVFSEVENPASDRSLSKAISEAGNVVEGFFFRNDSTGETGSPSSGQIRKSRINLVQEKGAPEDSFEERPVAAPEFSGIETNIPPIGEGALGFGAFNIIPQEDGLYRAANLVYKYNDSVYPSLPLEALRRYYGGDIVLYTAPYGIEKATINEKAIPLDEQGALTLNFYGPGGSFTTYPAVDVINGGTGPEAFKDRLVFVGVTEKAVYDIRPTPVDPLFPGVEIHATVAGNIIKERFLIRDTRVIILDLSLVLLLPFILSLILSKVRRTYISLMAFSILFAALIIGDFYLFSFYSIKPGVVFPALSLALSYLSSEAYRNVVVEKKSRYLRKAFSTYVSAQLVEEILKDPGRLKLGGEKRVVTVLFSDIRGFTTLSERLKPEELVKLLNEYLNPMTVIVQNEEGMLDKYIGDAVMAVFNAPLSIPDHPKRACAAALKMMEKLKELNRAWKDTGYPALEIGAGINTGEAVVGNMGAELRFDYTAIGDTVNLASRLEGMTKLYGAGIIVSEYTYNSVKDSFLFRELDLVRVKGKETPIVMYELLDPDTGDERGQELSRTFSKALSLYREKRFEEAKGLFEGLLERFPDDGPAKLYIKRCSEYIWEPPPEGWDGVFVAKTK